MVDKVVEWGLLWMQDRKKEKILIAPALAITNEATPASESFKLSMMNMEVLELVHFTSNLFVIVIFEFVKSSGCSRVYGLVTENMGLVPTLNESVKDWGFTISSSDPDVKRIL